MMLGLDVLTGDESSETVATKIEEALCQLAQNNAHIKENVKEILIIE